MLDCSDFKDDQAKTLRSIKHNKQVKVLAVSAGKGGVGKSSISINLALALQSMGNKVMLLDGDLSLANIDVMLGLCSKGNLSDVLDGRCALRDIILEGPKGLKIIPSASGVEKMASLSKTENAGLINAFNDLTCDLDYLLVDTAAGLSDTVLSFTRSSQEIIVIVCDEPTSITDAYALIKVMNKRFGINRFNILSNFIHTVNDGRRLFNKLYRVSERFLDVSLNYVGEIPHDTKLHRAIQAQSPVLLSYPGSKSAQAFKVLASTVKDLSWKEQMNSGTGFFLQKIIAS